MNVPVSVPLVTQGSAPCTPSEAVNVRVRPRGRSEDGNEDSGPGKTSLTRRGAGFRAVAHPDLDAMGSVVGGEEEAVLHEGQAAAERGGLGARPDVLEQAGAGFGAVAHPQLAAVDAVVRGEVDEVLARLGEPLDAGRRGTRPDILEQTGAGLGAVAHPQLHAVRAVVEPEEDPVGCPGDSR